MSETWWRFHRYQSNGKYIEPVEVVKRTECFVTLRESKWRGEHRVAIAGEFFPTFSAAKDFAVERFTREMQSAQSSLDSAREKLRKIKALEEPTPEVAKP